MSTQGTIRVSKETQELLKKDGRMGESFEQRIIRLLDELKNPSVKEVQHEI